MMVMWQNLRKQQEEDRILNERDEQIKGTLQYICIKNIKNNLDREKIKHLHRDIHKHFFINRT